MAGLLPLEVGKVAVLLSLHIDGHSCVGGILLPFMICKETVCTQICLGDAVRFDFSHSHLYVNGISVGSNVVEIGTGAFALCVHPPRRRFHQNQRDTLFSSLRKC